MSRSDNKSAHCLDTVRQVLMCSVDTGVLGQVWYNKDSPEAFPDFKTTHTCKNYDAIRQWAKDHQVSSVKKEYRSACPTASLCLS